MAAKLKDKYFRGRFNCRINDKGRLSLPAAFRENPSSKNLIITNSLYQGKKCLDVYTLRQWTQLEVEISRLSRLRPEVQAYQRFYMAGGMEVKLDSQCRMLIPQSLRQFAGLKEELMVVGLGRKFELWCIDRWNELYQDVSGNFDNIVGVVSELLDEK